MALDAPPGHMWRGRLAAAVPVALDSMNDGISLACRELLECLDAPEFVGGGYPTGASVQMEVSLHRPGMHAQQTHVDVYLGNMTLTGFKVAIQRSTKYDPPPPPRASPAPPLPRACAVFPSDFLPVSCGRQLLRVGMPCVRQWASGNRPPAADWGVVE